MTSRSLEVQIRRASIDDAARVAALFDEYRQFYGQAPDLRGARQFIGSRLEAGDSVLLLGNRDRHLVGFAQLYPSFSSLSMKRVWILNDLFVHVDYRRAGVGYALLEAAEKFAEGSDSKGLVLSTKKTNAGAKALYEARGWKLDEEFDQYERLF